MPREEELGRGHDRITRRRQVAIPQDRAERRVPEARIAGAFVGPRSDIEVWIGMVGVTR